MKANRHKESRRGLTAIEVLMAIMILALIAAVILPKYSRARAHPPIVNCWRNLKSVGLGFRIWANDNNDLYPAQVPDAEGGAMDSVATGDITRVFLVMSNELSVPKSVLCGADLRQQATNWASLRPANISYFIGIDAVDIKPDMILSGDRDIAVNGVLGRGTASLTTNQPVAWHKLLHREGGNLLCADGSVTQMNSAQLQQALANTGDAINRVLFPQ